MTIKKKIEYIGADKFVKFTNVDDFTELPQTTQDFLKSYGVVSNPRYYPYLTTNGQLKYYKDGFIQIGQRDILDFPFCIDVVNSFQIVMFNDRDNTQMVVNSSLEAYIGCIYAIIFYAKEYESKNTYGDFYQNKNNLKYAKKLRELLNETEKHIENYPIWEGEIYQKELGVV